MSSVFIKYGGNIASVFSRNSEAHTGFTFASGSEESRMKILTWKR